MTDSFSKSRTNIPSTTKQDFLTLPIPTKNKKSSEKWDLEFLQKLLSYLPPSLLRDLQRNYSLFDDDANGHEGRHYNVRDVEGVMVIADLAGFVKLTEKIRSTSQTLEHGLDKVNRLVNEYFGKASTVISNHGGDVLHYAGDAVVAFFPSETEFAYCQILTILFNTLEQDNNLSLLTQTQLIEELKKNNISESTIRCFYIHNISGNGYVLMNDEKLTRMGIDNPNDRLQLLNLRDTLSKSNSNSLPPVALPVNKKIAKLGLRRSQTPDLSTSPISSNKQCNCSQTPCPHSLAKEGSRSFRSSRIVSSVETPLPEPCTIKSATLTAVAASFTLMETIEAIAETLSQSVPHSEDLEPLCMHIAITTGNFHCYRVGCSHGWEVVVAGGKDRPFDKLNHALVQAQRGWIVIDPKGWELIESYGSSTKLQHDMYHLQGGFDRFLPYSADLEYEPLFACQEMKSSLSYLIPSRIIQPLSHSADQATFRHITMLFINIDGINYEETNALDKIQQVYSTIQENCAKYECIIKEFAVDDKGMVCLCPMGLAPAHDDDPIRGLYLALRIHEFLVEEMKLSCAIGITTGQAVCGTVGGKTRRELTVLGNCVNLAARIMGVAKEMSGVKLLCDNETYRSCLDKFNFVKQTPDIHGSKPLTRSNSNVSENRSRSASQEKFDPRQRIIHVKGIATGISVYQPSLVRKIHDVSDRFRQSTRVSRKTVFGREKEMMYLQNEIDGLKSGENAKIIFIQAEPGLGKTTLLHAVQKHADSALLPCYFGSADALERTTYSAWRSVIEHACNLHGESNAGKRDSIIAVYEKAPEYIPDLYILNSMFGLDFPELSGVGPHPASVVSTKIRALLIYMMKIATKNRPGLILLDDAHLFDSQSWTLALSVAVELPHMMLVFGLRTQDLSSFPSDYTKLSSLKKSHSLRLEPLDNKAITELAQCVLDNHLIDPDIIELIVEKSQRNPFFSEQIALSLRDSQQIELDTTLRWRFAHNMGKEKLAVPDTLRGVVNSRLDQLSPPDQLILKVASVVGRVFEFNLLSALYPKQITREDLRLQVKALVTRDILKIRNRDLDNMVLVFQNALLQECAYSSMLFGQRRQLHKLVAEWYEDQSDKESYPKIAYHFMGSETWDRAFTYLEKAGEESFHNFSMPEACKYFEQALQLEEQIRKGDIRSDIKFPREQLASWKIHSGVANMTLGNSKQARIYLEEGLAHYEDTLPVRKINIWATKHWEQMKLRTRIGDVTASKNVPEMIKLVLMAYENLFEIYCYSQQRSLAQTLALRAVNIAAKYGCVSHYATELANLSICTSIMDYSRKARKVIRDPACDVVAKVHVLSSSASLDMSMGLWPDARRALVEACNLSISVHDRRRWEVAQNNLGLVYYLMGDYQNSMKCCQLVLESGRSRGDIQIQCFSYLGMSRTALLMGDLDSSDKYHKQRHRLLGKKVQPNVPSSLNSNGILSLIRVFGPASKAHECLRRFVKRMKSMAQPFVFLYPGFMCAGIASLMLYDIYSRRQPFEKHRLQKSFLICNTIAEESERFKNHHQIAGPLAGIMNGWVLWCDGHEESARKVWKSAENQARDMNMLFERGFLLYLLGTRGQESNIDLKRAWRLFDSLKARFAKKLCEDVIQSTFDEIPFSLSTEIRSALFRYFEEDKEAMEAAENTPKIGQRMLDKFKRFQNEKIDRLLLGRTEPTDVLSISSFNDDSFDETPTELETEINIRAPFIVRDIPQMGRDFEMIIILEMVKHLARGSSVQIVIVEGEHGRGKSKLIENVCEESRVKHNCSTLVGISLDGEESVPYFSWREIIADLFGYAKDRTNAVEQINTFLEQLPPAIASLTPLLHDIDPYLDIKDNSITTTMRGNPQALLANTRRLVLALFDFITKLKPVVVVCDDAHYMDSASWQLLWYLAGKLDNTLFIVTHIPFKDAQRKCPFTVDELRSLTPLNDRKSSKSVLSRQHGRKKSFWVNLFPSKIVQDESPHHDENRSMVNHSYLLTVPDFSVLPPTVEEINKFKNEIQEKEKSVKEEDSKNMDASVYQSSRNSFFRSTVKRIVLGRLSDEDIIEIVCYCFDVKPPLPPQLRTLLIRKSRGNPFLAQQYALVLLEASVLIIRDGQCHIPPSVSDISSAIKLPDESNDIILSRITSIPQSARITLNMAVVIGRSFDENVLQKVHPASLDKIQLARNLNMLIQSGIIVKTRQEPPTYFIRSSEIKNILYIKMTKKALSTTHKRIAEYLEQENFNDITRVNAQLAQHWTSASNIQFAIKFCTSAGIDAQQKHVLLEAMEFFQKAQNLLYRLDPAEQRTIRTLIDIAKVQRLLGEVYMRDSKPELAKEVFLNTISTLGDNLPKSQIQKKWAYGKTLIKQWNHSHFSDTTLSSWNDDLGLQRELANMYLLLSDLAVQSHDSSLTYITLRTVNLAEKSFPFYSVEQARIYSNILRAPQIPECIRKSCVGRAHRIAKYLEHDHDDASATAYLNWKLSESSFRNGEWDKVRRECEKAAKVFIFANDRNSWWQSYSLIINSYMRQGDFQEALRENKKMRSQQKRDIIYGEEMDFWCYVTHCICLLHLGYIKDAVTVFMQLEDQIMPKMKAQVHKVRFNALKFHICQKIGRNEESFKAGEAAVNSLRQNPSLDLFSDDLVLTMFIRLLNYCSITGYKWPSLNTVALNAVNSFVEQSEYTPVNQPRALLRKSEVYRAIKRPVSLKDILSACEKASKFKLVYDEGLCYLEAAHLSRGTPNCERYLKIALDLFVQVHCVSDVRKTHTLLDNIDQLDENFGSDEYDTKTFMTTGDGGTLQSFSQGTHMEMELLA